MTTEVAKTETGISGSTLKLVAVITMLIDHAAAAILIRYFYATDDWSLYSLYYIMREIGRIAFPIYCFMLVEGLERTQNRGKYLLRMAGFALISEIPFDLAFSSRVLEFGYQNVFFTLTIALAAMIVLKESEERLHHPALQGVVQTVVITAGAALAYVMKTDYDFAGILCILAMYVFRKNRFWQLFVGYALFVLLLSEWAALPAFVLLAFYKGKKGFSGKWFFYGFYPIHLLILYFVCVILEIASYSAI